MSSSRYLEFDSTYRDRKLYPNPSDFVVQMSESGLGTKLNARDPVSESSPILIWNNSFRQTTGANYIGPLYVSPSPTTTTSSNQGTTTFLLNDINANLKQVRNFYIGCVLATEPNNASFPFQNPVITRRIIDYQPLNLSNAMITLDCPLPDSVVGSPPSGTFYDFYICNPTPIPTNTANAVIKFYIPGSNDCLNSTQRTQNYGFGGDNYYHNYYIMNTDSGEYKKITGFDAVSRLATLESSTSNDWANVANSTTNFAIRKEIPKEIGVLLGAGARIIYGTTSAIQLPTSAAYPYNNSTDTYNGDFIRITPKTGASSPYDITDNTYTAPIPTNYPNNCQTEEKRINKYVFGTGTVVAVNGLVITLSSSASLGTEYIGCFISNLNSPQASPNWPYPSVSVSNYNPITREITLSSALAFSVGDVWLIRTCFLSEPLTYPPTPENNYEIELFSKDNYSPFIYTGSIVSSQEVVCYEVELLNLILPNALLSSGRGGRPIFYPYLYVALEQISSAGTTSRNIIYSNNPHSYRMLYRAVVDDTPIPAVSPFIKIDGDGMVHTIKFKPNDSFRFSVYHTNGELFKTVFTEQFSPSAPNALIQISACFAFKRV